MIQRISERYRKRKQTNPRLVSLENEDLNGSAQEFELAIDTSRISAPEIHNEEFLEIERTESGYEAHVLEEFEEKEGHIGKIYTEEILPEEELGDAVKGLDIGDKLKIHFTGKDAAELARKRAPYIHAVSSLEVEDDDYTRHVIAKNQLGLHARPCAMLAKEASQYDCDVTAKYAGKTISAKSLMGWMTFGASYGAKITLRAEDNSSDDALRCLDGLESLFENKFGEN